jgi:hypothetical protein
VAWSKHIRTEFICLVPYVTLQRSLNVSEHIHARPQSARPPCSHSVWRNHHKQRLYMWRWCPPVRNKLIILLHKNWDDGNRNLRKPPFDSTPLTYLTSSLSPLYRSHESEEWIIKARRKKWRSSRNSITITAQDVVCICWGKTVNTHKWWEFRNSIYTAIGLTLSTAG